MSDVKVFEATRSGPNSRRRVKSTGFQASERIRVAAYVRVSTDDDEQLGSFESQKKYYSEKIRENKDWAMVGIFADEGITGTNVNRREQFLKMIDRCMAGEIDMILTKSISRFARNTLDTLNYVRMLKDKNIAVVFEKENIDTLSMDGELMLTIMSSFAQQEVESLSSNVKMGFAMKMQRGEMVGFNGCLGYDYDPRTKTITVNRDEAETVRIIFNLYLQGYGAHTIAKMLTEMEKKNKKGKVSWHERGVMELIKNEKYKGDLRLQKTFTTDPITKRRLTNMGEEKMFYIQDHHEAIVTKEIWDRAQEIRIERRKGKSRGDNSDRGPRKRKYAFSEKCECGFCGRMLTRRTRQQTTTLYKPVWQCMNATANGIVQCPNCKSIDEKVLEDAFMDAFRQLVDNYDDIMESVLATVKNVFQDNDAKRKTEHVSRNINKLEAQISQLTGMLLDGVIEKEEYDKKISELKMKLRNNITEKELLTTNSCDQKSISKRMNELSQILETQDPLDKFDRIVFESIVEKVIVGEYDSDGKPVPYKLTFILKNDQNLTADYDRNKYKEKQREIKRKEEYHE